MPVYCAALVYRLDPSAPTSEHRTAGSLLRHAEMIAVRRRRPVNLVIFTVWRVIWNRMSFCYCGYPLNCRLRHQMSVFTAVCRWQHINSSSCCGKKWKGTSRKITGTEKGLAAMLPLMTIVIDCFGCHFSLMLLFYLLLIQPLLSKISVCLFVCSLRWQWGMGAETVILFCRCYRIYEYNQKIVATRCYSFIMHISYGLVPAGVRCAWVIRYNYTYPKITIFCASLDLQSASLKLGTYVQDGQG